MRVPKCFVVGTGACCDLRLSERGIASHHAMLSVEGDVAYITPLSDSPTLVDGEAIVRRQRLRPHVALTFGPTSFRVEYDGPVADPFAGPTDTQAANEPVASRQNASTPPTSERDRTATPNVSPQDGSEVRFTRAAPRQRRKSSAWFTLLALIAVIASALLLWSMVVYEANGWKPGALLTQVESIFTSTETSTTRADASFTAATAASAPTHEPSPMPEPSPIPEPIAEPNPAPTPVQRTPPIEAPLATPSATAEGSTINTTATLLSEAEALESNGHGTTPRGMNAAEHYVRVLQADPDSEVAHGRLDAIVSTVAREAGDMILHQRFDGARRSLEQLAVAIPKGQRSLVGKGARDQWRVVELVLEADALIQQYRLVGPDDPNAVGLLREALRIDPKNAIADEMLSKAYGLQAEHEKE
jgi:hypothetical protein